MAFYLSCRTEPMAGRVLLRNGARLREPAVHEVRTVRRDREPVAV
jgi:hypothetical protein